MPNVAIGGFRVAKTGNLKAPQVIAVPVANNYGTAIFTGDLVIQANDGTAQAAAAGSTMIWGLCLGVHQYWDGQVVRKGSYLPANTVYGTNLSRQSQILIAVATNELVLEGDCDDNVTATTRAAYQAFIGENCDINAGGGGNTVSGRSSHSIDISTHIPATAQLRLWAMPNVEFMDYAAANVKLQVRINESHLWTAAGV